MIHTQLYKINVISICKTFPNQISHHTAIKREEFMFPMIMVIKKWFRAVGEIHMIGNPCPWLPSRHMR